MEYIRTRQVWTKKRRTPKTPIGGISVPILRPACQSKDPYPTETLAAASGNSHDAARFRPSGRGAAPRVTRWPIEYEALTLYNHMQPERLARRHFQAVPHATTTPLDHLRRGPAPLRPGPGRHLHQPPRLLQPPGPGRSSRHRHGRPPPPTPPPQKSK